MACNVPSFAMVTRCDLSGESSTGQWVVEMATGGLRPSVSAVLILTACVWAGSFMLSTFRDLAIGTPNLMAMTVTRLGFAVVGALLCWPLYLVLRRLAGWPIFAQFAAGLIGSSIAAGGYTWAIFIVTDIAAAAPATDATWQFYNTVYWGVFFLAWSAMYLALSYGQQVARQAEQLARAEALAHEAQLRALRYQVDPHFLFNTLNSVSALVMTDRNDDAEEMLEELARFFRSSLSIDPQRDLALYDEVELQRKYLRIEQIRFPELAIEIEIEPAVAKVPVPALLLQPLVENAIKFGVAARERAASVAIRAEAVDRHARIVIQNDKRGDAERQGTGTGIRNVRERLVTRFGTGCSLDARAGEPDGFVVTIEIPREPQE